YMAVRKKKEHDLAQIYYTEQGLTGKEIAEKLSVSEKTVGEWVELGRWKEVRNAKMSGHDNLKRGYHELLQMLIDKRISLEKKGMTEMTKEDKDEYARIIDEISKVSRSLEHISKDGKPSLK